MAELDVLERRVVAALLGYAGEVPDAVDAAAVARRVALEHPRRGASVLRWRPTGVPRAAWVLLLAALLTAMVVGSLAVGGLIQREVPAVVPPLLPAYVCPPGSTPDEPGPVDQARPPGAGPMAFDRAAGKIVMLADAGTWTFDVCTNSWTLMQLGAGPSSGLALVHDPRADLIIGVEYGDEPPAPVVHAWTYDRADNTWTRKGPAPDHVARLWYDTASAQVGAWTARSDEEPGTVWTYDVASDAWAAVGALEVLGGYGWNTPGDLLAYDANLDRVVVTDPGGERTRLLDVRTGTVLDARALAPWAGHCGFFVWLRCYDQSAGTAIAYDEQAGQVVVLIGGRVFAYDAVADRWATLSGDPGAGATREAGSMVYDPVNERLVVLPGGLYFPVDSVLAFDTTTRAWTLLLEASEVPRASNAP